MKISRKHLWPELTQCIVFLDHILSRSMTRPFSVDDVDLEDVEASKERDRPSHFLRLPNIQNQSLLSGLAYCIASCSMILVNKFVLSGYGFNAGIFLMLYQVYCYG
jgi:GDP-mannose transporter